MLLSAVALLSFGLNVEAKEMEESAVYEISAADFEEIEPVNVDKENLGFIPVEDINTSVEQMIAEEVYQKMRPDYLFMPVAKKGDREKANRYLETIKELVGAKASYLSCDGDITIKIW